MSELEPADARVLVAIVCLGRALDDTGQPTGDTCGAEYRPPWRPPARPGVERWLLDAARAAGWRIGHRADGTPDADVPALRQTRPGTGRHMPRPPERQPTPMSDPVTRHINLADSALTPVRDLLDKTRLNIPVQFNPLVMQMALEYARIQALLAIAAGWADTDPDGVGVDALVADELAAGARPLTPPQPEPATPGNGGGLILPG